MYRNCISPNFSSLTVRSALFAWPPASKKHDGPEAAVLLVAAREGHSKRGVLNISRNTRSASPVQTTGTQRDVRHCDIGRRRDRRSRSRP